MKTFLMATQESRSCNADRRELSRTSQAGLVLLSSTIQVVYLNLEAGVLLKGFALRPVSSTDFPSAIRSFSLELLETLPPSPGSADREHVRLSRTAVSPSGRVILRAFGIPSPLRPGDGQLLVLIDRLDLSDERGQTQPASATPIHLTSRERAVMRYLLDGLTNKEIANKLRISEHTVKVHLKRVMKKTQVTTRTAMVSRLLSDHSLLAQLANATAPSEDQDIHALAV